MAKKNMSFFPTAARNAPGVKTTKAQSLNAQPKQEEEPTPAVPLSPVKRDQVEIEQVIEQHVLTPQTVSFQEIPLERIRPNPFQARADFDTEESKEDIEELAQSIREHGFVSVLLVRPDPSEDGYFQLAYGERRWRAAKLVTGLDAVPCRIASYTDEQMEDIGLIENIQRKALNPMDEALALQRKMGRIDPRTGKTYSIRGLADHLGLKKHRIEEPLRLCEIPVDVQAMVRKRADTVRVAYEIAKLPTPDLRRQLIDKVLEHGVNTRDIIYLVNQLLEEAQQRDKVQPANLPPTTEQIVPHVEEDNSLRSQGEFVADSFATSDAIAAKSPFVSVATFETVVSPTILETPTASAAKEQLSEHPGTSSTKFSVAIPAPVTPRTVSSQVNLSVSLDQRLQEKRINEDSKSVLATIKRWSSWVKEGTHDKALLRDHVGRWKVELEDLEDSLQFSPQQDASEEDME